jgi:uncharacterized membrane protein
MVNRPGISAAESRPQRLTSFPAWEFSQGAWAPSKALIFFSGILECHEIAFGVPMHPLLVHFPIALWLAAPVLDLAALYAGPEPWRTLALGSTILGILIGAAAIMTGLLEYLEPSVAGIDLRLAARHGVRTSLAWCVFAAKMIFITAFSPVAPWSITVCLAFDLLGCVLLVQGVYLGTKQVYEQLEKQ